MSGIICLARHLSLFRSHWLGDIATALEYNVVCTSQAANRETGANCKNLSLHRGKAVIKQRFQTGSVDEVCFLGKLLSRGYGLEMLDFAAWYL